MAPFGRLAAVSAIIFVLAGAAHAEAPEELETRSVETRREYEQLKRQIGVSDEKLGELEAEIAGLRKDHATLTAALIQVAKTEKKVSEDIQDIEGRLVDLRERESALRLSLGARRGVLAEVLAALQRMGLNPPPALLVRPEDALASVRSAILLGAVVPEIREETEMLVSDLSALKRITASIGDERDRLVQKIAEQAEEKARLSKLLAERDRLRERSEAVLAEERRKAEILVARAANLEELIGALEVQIEELRKAEAERRKREAELAQLPVPEANRLAVAQPFAKLRDRLALPAAGRIIERFGTPDSVGGRRNGDTVQTQSGAIVTAPADAIVLYSGPFRSYGQVLILDAGDGYHVILAGLDRTNVSLGQSILAGEPVGAMGEVQLASTAMLETGNANPKLYIEFRKDGKPIDPAPWWADRESGRTGNDS